MMLTYDASKKSVYQVPHRVYLLKVLISGNISFKKFLGLIVLLLVLLWDHLHGHCQAGYHGNLFFLQQRDHGQNTDQPGLFAVPAF